MGNMCGGNLQGGEEMINVGISDADLVKQEEVSVAKSKDPVEIKVAEDFDLEAFNGSWIQSRSEGLEDFFKNMKVPWLVKKMILKVKPKQELTFTKEGFHIQMSGGPKTPKPTIGNWGESFESTNPRGLPVTMKLTVFLDPVRGTCVKFRSEGKEGVDLATRFMEGDEMVLEIGPKRSLLDEKKVMTCRRYFKRI